MTEINMTETSIETTEDLDLCEVTIRQIVIEHIDSPTRVSEARALAALDFLDVLPERCPAPAVHVALDGELSFLWQQGRKKLTVLPGVDGWISFDAEFGNESRMQREPFVFPKLPTTLAAVIDTFTRCDA